MAKYIDAEKLYAKVDDLMAHYAKYENEVEDDTELSIFYQGKRKMCSEIINLIASFHPEQSSLPDNLDEAAKEYEDWVESYSQSDFPTCVSFRQAFKAGAEWMAKQGVILNLPIDELSCGAYNSCVEQGLTSEDDVIIQVRKKQL